MSFQIDLRQVGTSAGLRAVYVTSANVIPHDGFCSLLCYVCVKYDVSSRQEMVGNSSLYIYVCSGGCLVRLGNIAKKRSSS